MSVKSKSPYMPNRRQACVLYFRGRGRFTRWYGYWIVIVAFSWDTFSSLKTLSHTTIGRVLESQMRVCYLLMNNFSLPLWHRFVIAPVHPAKPEPSLNGKNLCGDAGFICTQLFVRPAFMRRYWRHKYVIMSMCGLVFRREDSRRLRSCIRCAAMYG